MVPDSSDWLKRAVRHGASSAESSLRTLVGILSGPEALWGLSSDSSLRTPASWAVTLPILVLLGPNQGMKEVSSRVKNTLEFTYEDACLVAGCWVEGAIYPEQWNANAFLPQRLDVWPEWFRISIFQPTKDAPVNIFNTGLLDFLAAEVLDFLELLVMFWFPTPFGSLVKAMLPPW